MPDATALRRSERPLAPDTRRRRRPALRGSDAHKLTCFLAAFSITLVRLPVLSGHDYARYAALAPFLGAIGWLGGRSRHKRSDFATGLLVAYVALVSLGVARASALGVYGSGKQAIIDTATIAIVAAFGVMLISRAANWRERRDRLIAVCLSPTVYVAANIVLLGAGFAGVRTGTAAGAPSELLSLVGITARRVAFPLSTGVNAFGAIAAAGFAASCLLALRTPDLSRRVSIPAIFICLYGCLVSDSRGALLVAVAVVAAFSVGRHYRGVGLVAILPLSPFLVIAAVGLLANTQAVTALSRSGNGDLLTATNRLYIWQPVISFLERPSPEQVVGYGANGQITSGIEASYAYLYANDTTIDATTVTTHNIVLQTILDFGWLGLALSATLVLTTITRLRRVSRAYALTPFPAMLAIFTVLVLCGATEALPSYTFLDTLVPCLLIVGASCTEMSVPRRYRPARVANDHQRRDPNDPTRRHRALHAPSGSPL